MELFDFMELLVKAIRKDLEEKLWQQWLMERPLMQEVIYFPEYKNKFFGDKIENKKVTKEVSKKEALERAEAIVKLDKEGR